MNSASLRLLFLGFGNVARKAATLMLVEHARFPKLRRLNVSIVGIFTKSRGAIVNSRGVDVVRALKEMSDLGRISPTNLQLVRMASSDAVRQLEYDVLIELTT